MSVRRATVVDLNDMLDIARESYGRKFDPQKAQNFGLTALLSPQVGAFRDDDAFCMVGLSTFWWESETRANVMFLAVRKRQAWQAVKVMRAALQWAKSKGAGSFEFGEETGMRMEAIARRIGATQNRPSYRIDLRSPQHRFWMEAA